MATRQINLRIPADLLQKIDQTRGLIPRNTWIVDVLAHHLVEHRVDFKVEMVKIYKENE